MSVRSNLRGDDAGGANGLVDVLDDVGGTSKEGGTGVGNHLAATRLTAPARRVAYYGIYMYLK